jgi:hypothetical protein
MPEATSEVDLGLMRDTMSHIYDSKSSGISLSRIVTSHAMQRVETRKCPVAPNLVGKPNSLPEREGVLSLLRQTEAPPHPVPVERGIAGKGSALIHVFHLAYQVDEVLSAV